MTKIGIFDSGLGGLSVAASVREKLPYHDILYIADSRYAPYGDKTLSDIESRVDVLSRQLINNGCDIIVVACNTATVNVINKLRTAHGPIFVGVEPGVKPAVEITANNRIGVLVTQRTADSLRFNQFIDTFASQASIHVQACPGLVEQVETLQLTHADTQRLVAKYVGNLLLKEIDTLVLGCTHYPFLLAQIKQTLPVDVTVVNTNDAIANQVARMVEAQHQVATVKVKGTFEAMTTGDNQRLKKAVESLLSFDVMIKDFT